MRSRFLWPRGRKNERRNSESRVRTVGVAVAVVVVVGVVVVVVVVVGVGVVVVVGVAVGRGGDMKTKIKTVSLGDSPYPRAPGEPALWDDDAIQRQTILPQILTAVLFLALVAGFLYVALRRTFEIMP